MMLSPEHFAAFFEEVYGHPPFPWQRRLLETVASKGDWPEVLDLPTGSGKTAAIDVAAFHLALEAGGGDTRRAPVRIAFVVDRRLVVDDAFLRAQKLEAALASPPGPVTRKVADSLRNLSREDLPMVARRLRGGIPLEDDWARTPTQPTVLCSTVDQIGSRLLFRGYGVSDSMKPVHAGLIGADCLILLDEAHLAEPFRQTLDWARIYRGEDWRERNTHSSPWDIALLTATPGMKKLSESFSLDEEDKRHPILAKRLDASKPAHLFEVANPKSRSGDGSESSGEEKDKDERDIAHRAEMIAGKVKEALAHFKTSKLHAPFPAIGVVVNRIARAREVFKNLTKKLGQDEADCLLLIGASRPADRDRLVDEFASIRTGAERALVKPQIIVATQCIEAGVDIDLDALITEAAPLDCLRQRFGRLNRAGRDFEPYAAILAFKSDLSTREDDPVYGKAILHAWDCLKGVAANDGKTSKVEFGLNAFAVPMENDALARKEDAPVFLPAHLDLFSQTAPIPTSDPDVSLYLHGASRKPDSITVVWRADIDPGQNPDDNNIRRLLTIVPPRSLESIELPLWAVRRWLKRMGNTLIHMADIASAEPDNRTNEADASSSNNTRKIYRWKGDDDRSRWIEPDEIRPGDTIIVPAHYGGVDKFGWNPEHRESEIRDGIIDIGSKAAKPFSKFRFAVRVAPKLLDESDSEKLANALASAPSTRWQDLKAVVVDLGLPEEIREDLNALDRANDKKNVAAYLDLYGTTDNRPRGIVFVARNGIKGGKDDEDGRPNTTENDAYGSISGFPLSLQQHNDDVERTVENFAKAACIPNDRVVDLKIAGFLHDLGKADPRFQAWLHFGDPLGPDMDDEKQILAKSGRLLPSSSRAASDLPKKWRHEAFSVRLAPKMARFNEAKDPELVLWLIGTHHGHGRPFYPHSDAEDERQRKLPSAIGLPSELPPEPGPQSLAYDYHGLDWPSLFAHLKARYGAWELARMESILRLADHRASESRARENFQ